MSKVTLYLGRGGLCLKTDFTAWQTRGCSPKGVPKNPLWNFEIADLWKFMVEYRVPPWKRCRMYFTTKEGGQEKGQIPRSVQKEEKELKA